MKIDANFEGGNITVIDASNPKNIQLHIRKDSNSDEHSQWLYFRVSMAKGIECNFSITNANTVSYPEAWPTCTLVTSTDRKNWFRLNTEYDDVNLSFLLTPETDVVYVALFAPYSYERHLDLVSWSLNQPHCQLVDTQNTVDNHQIELLKISSSLEAKKNIWIIARQHPAETMAEWFIEGLLEELLGENSSLHSDLLSSSNIYIVPNMNPDGTVSGNLRTNGAGIDLNRAWLCPDETKSPETHFILEKMHEIGVDLFLDIHGDEDIPYAFIQGCEGNPSYTETLAALDKKFRVEFNKATLDFCIDNGYPPFEPNTSPLNAGAFHVGEEFGCLSLIIEMPFTDNKYMEDKIYGWTPERSKNLGVAVLHPIKSVLL